MDKNGKETDKIADLGGCFCVSKTVRTNFGFIFCIMAVYVMKNNEKRSKFGIFFSEKSRVIGV